MHSFNSIAVFKVVMEGGTRYKESYLDGPVKKKLGADPRLISI